MALKELYTNEVVPAMMKEFGYKNALEVPKVEKVVISMGVGEATQNPDALEDAVKDLTRISGQKPVVTRAKRSISSFKVREGMNVGCKVTLRGKRMYDFLEKLFNIVLPRVRDFRGMSPYAFDGRGNYSLGLKEQLIFPEIDYDQVSKIRGMNITITTTAKTDEEAYYLLKALGMPFKE
ncbi:MAG TPA: 50S ribosomal protein L5 [Bacillota bacterium]|nr:50S ribosomal protein L5 [Candidatus Fermentithermobacillaceae bacterium]HOB30425.1 50S ribosomal protein L5 [Bacillota bacterium]HOK64326.1 50S ribosomal protein L5 [Bacillota bacterium]HOQ03034.1 50S ribosomal protein L5 [Bacillota bacterium]HPP60628.1 50S ribosomal protein L5 [Bacillota bacterium]